MFGLLPSTRYIWSDQTQLADILYLHQNRATQLLLLVQRALLLQALP
jgi:hypothetical protein